MFLEWPLHVIWDEIQYFYKEQKVALYGKKSYQKQLIWMALGAIHKGHDLSFDHFGLI